MGIKVQLSEHKNPDLTTVILIWPEEGKKLLIDGCMIWDPCPDEGETMQDHLEMVWEENAEDGAPIVNIDEEFPV